MDRRSGSAQQLEAFKVGPWLIEPPLNRLSKEEEHIRLEPKVMQVLCCLADRPGKTVTKKQFMERVWTDTVVTDDVLSRCISELRKALGDDARNPRFIETIRKTGYRLIAPVSDAPEGEAAEEPATTATKVIPVSVLRHTDGASDFISSPPSLWSLWNDTRIWLRREAYGARHWIAAAVLLLTVSGALLLRYVELGAASTPPETVPFTSLPGSESDPSLSPQGDRVAFVWDGSADEQADVYIKQTGAATPLQLTNHPGTESNPTWSPDGRFVAFTRSIDEENAIFIVPSIGGGERKVASFGARKIQGLVWSPDGKTLALAAQQAPYEPYSLFLLSVDTHEKRQLTLPPAYYQGDTEPAFSPDGQALAFVRGMETGSRDIYVVPASGGVPKRLTADYADVTGLDWTKDGKSIIFTSDRAGASGLWQVPAAGGNSKHIPTANGRSPLHQPSIARQGKQMIFTQRSFDTNIWRLNWIRGYGNTTSRLVFSTRHESNPDISPDGKRIAFTSDRSGHSQIWMINRDGTNPVQLTSKEGVRTRTPRWSPQGTRLVFSARQGANADLYVMKATGGASRRLTTASSSEVAPSWSRNGRWIYFASNRSGSWQLWKKPAAGGSARRVTMDGGFAAFESPNGQQLFYVKRDQPGIWRRPVGGGPATRIIDALEPYDWGNWTVLKRGIYFVRRDEDGPILAFYRFASQRVTPIAELAKVPHHPSLAAAPDGAWFLYTQIDRRESDILLVENFR